MYVYNRLMYKNRIILDYQPLKSIYIYTEIVSCLCMCMCEDTIAKCAWLIENRMRYFLFSITLLSYAKAQQERAHTNAQRLKNAESAMSESNDTRTAQAGEWLCPSGA